MVPNFSWSAIANPPVIADILTLLISSIILVHSFNRGVLAVLLKLSIAYASIFLIIPNLLSVLVPSISISNAFWSAIIAYVVFLVIVFTIVDRITPNSGYGLIDNMLGLVVGTLEITLLLSVITSVEKILRQSDSAIKLPTYIGAATQGNLTGFLMSKVQPISDRITEDMLNGKKLSEYQDRVVEHFGVSKYLGQKVVV